MAIFQVESDTCHGRGFSRDDSNGYLARLASFLMRPASDGASQNFTVNATTDQATCSTHGYSNGDPIIVTSTTTLPTPLAESTEYYVIYVDPNTFQFAATYGDAVDGTAINLTDTGTGTHSVYAKGGGANLNVWADYSDSATQNFATTDVNTGTDEITITGHGLEHFQKVQFTTTGGLPAGISAGTTYYMSVVDANTIKLSTTYTNAFNATYVDITTVGSGTHTIVPYELSMIFCNTVGAAANDIDTGPDGGPPKFIRIAMHTEFAACVTIQFAMWHDTTTHATYGYWNGQIVQTYDDADFAFDFRGGDETFLFSSRLGSAWDAVGMDTFVGDSNLLEGTDKVGVLQGGVSSGSSVVLQLDTGEATNFTADKYYYIFDFDGLTNINYVKVESVNTGTDQITIETLYDNFAAGAVIGAYVHRWAGFGNGNMYLVFGPSIPNVAFSTSSYPDYSSIPYISRTGGDSPMHDQYNSMGDIQYLMQLDAAREYMEAMNNNDEGNQAVMRPGVCEVSNNRAYGILKNTYILVKNTMAAFLDGKTIAGKNYLYTKAETDMFYGSETAYGVLVLDTESTS